MIISVADSSCSTPVGLFRPETILLVEDDERIRALTAEVLQIEGYGVVEAGDAESALQTLKMDKLHIDLLLTDVVLPGRSGRELARAILRTRPAVPVIFMSGYEESAVTHDGLGGFNAPYLQKPFSLDVLVRTIQQALDPSWCGGN